MKFLKLFIICAIGINCASMSAMDNDDSKKDETAKKALEIARQATANQERSTLAIMIDVYNQITPYVNVDQVPDLLAKLIDGDESAVRALIKAVNSQAIAKAVKPQDYAQLTRDLEELRTHYLKHGTFTPAIKVKELTARTPAEIDRYITARIQQKLASYNPNQINQFRGAVIGFGGIVTLWLLGHTLIHNAMELMEPSYLAAGVWLMVTAYVLYQAIHKLSDNNTYQHLMMNYVAPVIATFDDNASKKFVAKHTAPVPVITALPGGLPATNQIILAAHKKRKSESFWDTLSPMQLALIPAGKLEEYKKNPRLVMTNVALINSLVGLKQTNALNDLIWPNS